MLLIPILRIIKYQYEMSIIPFLYIGPFVFALPFLAVTYPTSDASFSVTDDSAMVSVCQYWTWSSDVRDIPFIDDTVRRWGHAR